MSDYVPSVGAARARYCDSIVRKDGVPHSFVVAPSEHAKNHAEFDRMIAEVERAAAEKAWDRCVGEMPIDPDWKNFYGDNNPYRAAALELTAGGNDE